MKLLRNLAPGQSARLAQIGGEPRATILAAMAGVAGPQLLHQARIVPAALGDLSQAIGAALSALYKARS